MISTLATSLATLLATLLASFIALVFGICLLGVLILLVFLIALYFFPRMVLMMLSGAVFFLFLLGLFVDDEEEDLLNKDSYDSTAVFNVATRIEKIYGGKVYVGLRIPDPDSKSRENIDMVLITKGAVIVFSVWNFTGSVDIDEDGSWVGIDDQQHKREKRPSLVKVTKRQAVILASYLKLRGVTLPQGYLIGRVVLPDPNCRVTAAIEWLPEVISFNRWSQRKPELHLKELKPELHLKELKPELHLKELNPEPEPKPGFSFSNWFKAAFQGGKNDTQEQLKNLNDMNQKKLEEMHQKKLEEMHQKKLKLEEMHQKKLEEMHQKLQFILSTAPMWDRLELEGNRNILGEFIKFKGTLADTLALGNVKRSKVSRLVIQNSFISEDSDGLKRKVLYAPRDYRSAGVSAAEKMQAIVQSSTEIVFQPVTSKTMGKIKLSSVVSVSLSG